MPSKPFLPASVLQKVIPALNQGTVTFTRKDGKVVSEEPDMLDENGQLIVSEPGPAAEWSTSALFKHDVSSVVNGQWQKVTRLTVPVPVDYSIEHGDVVTWTGSKGRVVGLQPVGSSDEPGGYVVEVAA